MSDFQVAVSGGSFSASRRSLRFQKAIRETHRSPFAAQMVGIAPVTMRAWAHNRGFECSVAAPAGHTKDGYSWRIYSFGDLMRLRIISRLVAIGWRVERAIQALGKPVPQIELAYSVVISFDSIDTVVLLDPVREQVLEIIESIEGAAA